MVRRKRFVLTALSSMILMFGSATAALANNISYAQSVALGTCGHINTWSQFELAKACYVSTWDGLYEYFLGEMYQLEFLMSQLCNENPDPVMCQGGEGEGSLPELWQEAYDAAYYSYAMKVYWLNTYFA